MQVLAVVELDEPEHLHRHVRLVHDRAGEGKMPEVPGLRITDSQVHVGYVEEPVSIFPVEGGIPSSVEDFAAEGSDLAPLLLAWVKKPACVYSFTTLTVRSSDSKMRDATSSPFIFFFPLSSS